MITVLANDIRNGLLAAIPNVLRQTIFIALAFAGAGVILALSGYDLGNVVASLWRGIVTDPGGILRWATPMIMTGLAVSVAFRARAWNIGIDGQLFLGAFAAAFIGLQPPFNTLPREVAVPLAMLLAVLVGMLWALLAGALRVRFGANEIVTTLLLNFIAFYITDWLVLGPYADRGPSSNTFSTPRLAENVYIDRIMQGSQANVGLYIAILLALAIFFVLYRTTIGYEFKVVGSNAWFAQYGGIKVTRVFLLAMALSGAIAGLAGAIEMMGANRRFQGRFSDGLGFDGIVVAILASNHPIGVIFAGFFFGAFRNSAANLDRIAGVPRNMVEIVQAVIIIAVSAQVTWNWWRSRRKAQSAETPDSAPAVPAASEQ